MQYLFFALVAAGAMASLKNWRNGLYWMIVIGVLQDPVRKMVAGAPSYFVLSTMPVWLAICFKVWREERQSLFIFRRYFSRLRQSALLFMVTLFSGALVMISQGPEYWKSVILGSFSYLGPMIGVLVGFAFIKSARDIVRLLTFYCVVTSIVLIGTPLEYYGIFPAWKSLGTEVMDMQWIKYVTGGVTIYMKAGFYRSPDIMGWHAAMTAICSVILFLNIRSKSGRWLWLLIAVWAAFCIVISGRYKMVATAIVWGVLFAVLLMRAHKGSKIIYLALVAFALIFGINKIATKSGIDEGFLIYAASPLNYSTERLEKHGIESLLVTFDQSGFWGKGLGSATLGTQHTGQAVKTWQEGGAEKLMVELGVPGLVFFVLLVFSLARALKMSVDVVSKSSHLLYWHLGLAALFIANGLSFIVSYQVFGDPYIIILISFFLGLAFSGVRLRVMALQQSGEIHGQDVVKGGRGFVRPVYSRQ